jgi:signal transduction histidine kinase
MRTQFHSLLIQPPQHIRQTSIAIVLGTSFAIAFGYVAAAGSFGMLAFNLVPLILAVSWLGLGWGVTIAFLVTVLRAAGDFATAWINPDYFIVDAHLMRIVSNRVSGFLTFLCIVVIIHELILLSRQLEERVQARTTALQQAIEARERLQYRLLEAGVRERAAIGHDLHDGLGQHLTAAAMAANILSNKLRARGETLADSAHEVELLVRDGISQTRRIARGLLLESVSARQLESELEELVSTANENFRVRCRLTTSGPVESLDTSICSNLFYIAREALRNSLRHAEATHVDLSLTIHATHAQLSVVDDGIGLSPADSNFTAEPEGVGLQIMAQRAEVLGGTFEFSSPAASGTGTQLECRVPLAVLAA